MLHQFGLKIQFPFEKKKMGKEVTQCHHACKNGFFVGVLRKDGVFSIK